MPGGHRDLRGPVEDGREVQSAVEALKASNLVMRNGDRGPICHCDSPVRARKLAAAAPARRERHREIQHAGFRRRMSEITRRREAIESGDAEPG